MSAKTGTLYWLPRILGDETLDAASALILVGLADHVGQDDTCYVGFERLAEYGRCSYNTARRRVADLQERGWLEKIGRRRNEAGNLSVYVWRLVRHDDALEPTVGGRHDDALEPTDDSLEPKSGGPSAHQGGRTEPPRVEPPDLEPPRALALIDDAATFEDFYAVYPRKKDPHNAKRAWTRAIKTTDPAVIIDGARRFAADRAGEDPKFTPYPASWLNAGGWMNEPDARGPKMSRSTRSLAAWAARHEQGAIG